MATCWCGRPAAPGCHDTGGDPACARHNRAPVVREDDLDTHVPAEALDRVTRHAVLPLCPGCDTRHPESTRCITADERRWLASQGWRLTDTGSYRDPSRGRVEYPRDALRIAARDVVADDLPAGASQDYRDGALLDGEG